MECGLCRRVANALHPDTGRGVPTCYNDEGNRFIQLGSWSELKANTSCLTCSQIVSSFLRKGGEDWDQDETKRELWLKDFSNLYVSLSLQELRQRDSAEPLVIYIQPLETNSSDRAGVLLDPRWIDLEQLLKRLGTCDQTHETCHKRLSGPSLELCNPGMILISVSKECLISAEGNERYVALSYVWGDEQSPFSTYTSNIEKLKLKGSLSSADISTKLPGTIRRAIQFSALLNVEFLWVDRLCIIQDNPVHATAQVNRMDRIFSESYLTVCASDGDDAWTGLLGIKQCSQPRNVQQEVFTFRHGKEISKWVTEIDHIACTYRTRGWTFQEEVLSQRIVSFTRYGLVWQCKTSRWEERDFMVEQYRNEFTRHNIVYEDTLWPCIKKWDNLLNSFRNRRLTYEDDIIRAFSGIQEALSGLALGKFHYGLPENFFRRGTLMDSKRST